MQWQEIRAHYPSQWLLVEALKARSEPGRRIVEQLAVVNTCPDAEVAMKEYADLHRHSPERELYVLHTDRETIEIAERKCLGIRAL